MSDYQVDGQTYEHVTTHEQRIGLRREGSFIFFQDAPEEQCSGNDWRVAYPAARVREFKIKL